jgi:trans-aconitate 2-methyltransferase
MSDYWDKRFKAEGPIWGNAPSATALAAEKLFRERGVKSVLVPGSGYGRHTSFFAQQGYTVTGIEVSAEALALAPKHSAVTHHLGSVLDFRYKTGFFDAVYCFNVLHLFHAADRARFLEKISSALKNGGLAFFAVFSEEEPQFGQGPETEPHTFESKPGRPVHFFTDHDLRDSFRAFEILDSGLTDDPEEHGAQGPHTHRLRWIAAAKRPVHEFDGEKYRTASKHQKEWGHKLIDSLALGGDERVLDLGCGDGALSADIARLVPHGAVLGVDASEGMIGSARKHEGGNLLFKRLGIEDLDFRAEFDVVFSNATLHWVKDHRKLLRDCARALKPGGLLRLNFAGEGNCALFTSIVKQIMADARFQPYFSRFVWPWYMSGVDEYLSLVTESGAWADVRVTGENADRTMTRDELVRWLDQPSLVPFLEVLPPGDKAAFREAAVAAMLAATQRGEDQYFECFRRIDVSARKKRE